VLNKHFLYGLNGNVGINGLLTELYKVTERLNKKLVGLAFFLNELKQASG
jgi:hypothetical protein